MKVLFSFVFVVVEEKVFNAIPWRLVSLIFVGPPGGVNSRVKSPSVSLRVCAQSPSRAQLFAPCALNLPGSSVCGILQARRLDWVAISSSRGSSWPRDQTCVSCLSCIGRQILYQLCHLGSLRFPKNGEVYFSRQPRGLPSWGRTESDTTEAT